MATDPRADYFDARRGSIREAAERVFVRRGFDGATVHEIAEEAGVSAGSIYRYFDSKADLIHAVTEACGARYAEPFEALGASASSPLELLTSAGARIWVGLGDDGARNDAILNLEATLVVAREPALGAPIAATLGRMRRLLEGLIRDAQAGGELDRSLDPTALAFLLIAATGGTQTLALQLGPAVDVSAVWRTLEQLIAGMHPQKDEA